MTEAPELVHDEHPLDGGEAVRNAIVVPVWLASVLVAALLGVGAWIMQMEMTTEHRVTVLETQYTAMQGTLDQVLTEVRSTQTDVRALTIAVAKDEGGRR